MATPTGARHRDLEQRLRDIEAAVKSLVGAALRRQQLSVSSGDFAVSGGGSVVVQDGGSVRVEGTGSLETEYPNGATATRLGTFDAGADGALLQLFEDDGTTVVLQVFNQIGGVRSFTLVADDVNLNANGGSILMGNGLPNGVWVTGGLHADDVFVSPRGTTGSAANVRFNASGRLLEVTSSRRYKADIKDAPNRSDELLTVKGRTWRDRGEDADNTKQRHVGYIAEELHDAGLSEYVEYDGEGLPHAIQYDRLTVPLVQLAQRQQAQIDALSKRLEALEHPKPYPAT